MMYNKKVLSYARTTQLKAGKVNNIDALLLTMAAYEADTGKPAPVGLMRDALRELHPTMKFHRGTLTSYTSLYGASRLEGSRCLAGAYLGRVGGNAWYRRVGKGHYELTDEGRNRIDDITWMLQG